MASGGSRGAGGGVGNNETIAHTCIFLGMYCTFVMSYLLLPQNPLVDFANSSFHRFHLGLTGVVGGGGRRPRLRPSGRRTIVEVVVVAVFVAVVVVIVK